MALASRLAFCNIDTGEFIPLADSPGEPGTRTGDGRCDRAGNTDGVSEHQIGSSAPESIAGSSLTSLSTASLTLRAR